MTAENASKMLLASQSPRRRRLLPWLGLPFDVASVDTPECLDSALASDPGALASALAAEKAVAVREGGVGEHSLVLCFDTIVVLDGAVLGKPTDEADAWRMLRSLSGRTHQVVTGVAIMCETDESPRTFSVVTDVTMRPLEDPHITEWMAAGTYLGCAGAYNIEAQIAEVTESECYQNVAGLPLCHLHAALADLPEDCVPGKARPPIDACDAALGRRCRLGPRVVGD